MNEMLVKVGFYSSAYMIYRIISRFLILCRFYSALQGTIRACARS